jgi:hypothetical protein
MTSAAAARHARPSPSAIDPPFGVVGPRPLVPLRAQLFGFWLIGPTLSLWITAGCAPSVGDDAISTTLWRPFARRSLRGARSKGHVRVSDQSKNGGDPSGHHKAGLSGLSDSSQVWMLSLQMQALALAVEDLRGRLERIEQHLKLNKPDDAVRAELKNLERIW